MLEFEPVIGFEIHAQLTTRTKIFCGCLNETGGPPNSRTCPVCLGLPGSLPVLNEAVVDLATSVALALHANVAGSSGFSRKNYFYPDLPKGYQITQHAEPLATGGYLDIDIDGVTKRVAIRQIHIEEDAGKSVHAERDGAESSLIDLNRCGVPLVEIVTEPDIRSSAEADAFLREITQVLVYLGVTTGELHEGTVRFDTNVSVRGVGSPEFGTQTEIKNLNSFRSARRALDYEIERQSRVLREGGTVVHETLMWDVPSRSALPVRSKEGASDYRYFPEPDLVDFEIDEARLRRVREAMPELPGETRRRLVDDYGIPAYDASVLTGERGTLRLFEATVAAATDLLGGDAPATLPTTVANWVTVILGGYASERGTTIAGLSDGLSQISTAGASGGGDEGPGDDPRALATRIAGVVAARVRGDVSEPAARRLFEAVMESTSPADELIDGLGLRASSDGELTGVVAEVLAAHPEEVARYRSGTTKLMRFFVGRVLARTGGSADPEVAARLLEKELSSGGTT